jgi:DNA mismatch repair protein MutH
VWNLNARHGTALQLRPKGSSAKQMVWVTDDEGEASRTQPRGFYLRPSFTRGLMERYYRL